MRRHRLLPLCFAALAALAAAPAAAQNDSDGEPLVDYDPLSKEWNGLSRWAALCAGHNMPVASVTSLEWSELGAEDLLVLMYPISRVEPDKLEAFRGEARRQAVERFGQAAVVQRYRDLYERVVAAG